MSFCKAHIWHRQSISTPECPPWVPDFNCPSRVNVTTMNDQFEKYAHGCGGPMTYKACKFCGDVLL